jgi:hypothetical protein
VRAWALRRSYTLRESLFRWRERERKGKPWEKKIYWGNTSSKFWQRLLIVLPCVKDQPKQKWQRPFYLFPKERKKILFYNFCEGGNNTFNLRTGSGFFELISSCVYVKLNQKRFKTFSIIFLVFLTRDFASSWRQLHFSLSHDAQLVWIERIPVWIKKDGCHNPRPPSPHNRESKRT